MPGKTPISTFPINTNPCTPEEEVQNWGNVSNVAVELGDQITQNTTDIANIVNNTTIIGASLFLGILDGDLETNDSATVSRWQAIAGVYSDTTINDTVYSGGALSATIPSGTRIWYAKSYGSDTLTILNQWC